MASNLKRKRTAGDAPRKTRRVDNENSGMDSEVVDADNVSMALVGEGIDTMEDSGEEEEWGGVEDARNTEVPDTGIERRSGTKPKKPPTGEELRAIKDATDLFRSSSFKLQIDALLPNVRPKSSRIPPLDRFLLVLHKFLSGLPSVAPQHPLEASRQLLKKGVSVPYSLPLPTQETNWKVAFEKPSDITLMGSWGNKISVKPKDGRKFGVDLAIEMPDSLFQEKDYLNGRFFHKRAFYLANIAVAIQSSKTGLNVDMYYDSLQGDPRLTKLVLSPKKNGAQTDFTKLNAQVCIIPVLSTSSPIPLHRLSPAHPNIRITSSTIPSEDTKASYTPTPNYNTALLLALTPKANLLATHAVQQESPAFSDAVTLLRVWANQRGYSEGSRMCVHGFEGRGPWWSALLAALIAGEESREKGAKGKKRRPLGRGLSSYQLFKAALDFLAKHEFAKEPVFVKSKDGHRFPPHEYEAEHEAVFVDSSSLVNVLAGAPLGSLDLLRYDALKTLEMLDQTSISGDPFTDVFLNEQRDLPTRFDTVLRVDLSSAKLRKTSVERTFDLGSSSNALMESLASFIRQGLGDRSRAATVLRSSTPLRPLSQAHPSNPDIVYIGLVHDPRHAFRLVDHGAAADEQDQSVIEKFRELWGEKAELRRFNDGRIVESVVWDIKTADERAHVPAMIVRYILKRHFGIEEGSIQTWQNPFDSLLRLPESVSSLYLGSGIPTGFKGAITAFDNLVKAIKALDDELPLSILSVSPTSELLRYTSVFSPVPLPSSLAGAIPPNARYLAPIDMVLEFEKSSKWPDDLKAVQKIKLAFFERVASVLMESVEGLRAAVVIGDSIHKSEILDQSYLEIITREGWAFRARIWHDREATLLDHIVDGKDNVLRLVATKQQEKKGKDYQAAVEAKEVYTRRFIHAPRHHRAVAAICHHYSAFGGTVRLVKRWLASHWLLHGHITEEAVEILCAYWFIGDERHVGTDVEPGQTMSPLIPGSKERGFATVVHFLKNWKWEEGLFVRLYRPNASNLVDTAKSGAKPSGSGVWSISTELDEEGRMWTSHGPDLIIAHRVRALAEATWSHLQDMEKGTLNVQSLFVHPKNDYDFLIQLDSTLLPRYFHNVTVDAKLFSKSGKYANKKQSDENVAVFPGFDPARLFFDDLQWVYADTFKVFYDPFGGDYLGVVWDPSLKQPRPFRVLGGFSCAPIKKEHEKTKDKGMVVLNEDGVISEIERLGAGLIKTITVHA